MELVNLKRERHLNEGVLLLRDMGAILRHGESRVATLRLESNDGLPPVLAAGQLLAPEGAFTGGQRATSSDELPTVAREQAGDGVTWVKIVLDNFPVDHRPAIRDAGMLNYDEATVRAAVDAAHDAGARIAIHAFTPEGAEISIAAGADSLEHGWGIEAAMLDEMAGVGMAWTPTLCIDETLKGFGGERTPGAVRWIDEQMERLQPLIVEAHRLGIPLLAGTDSLAPVSAEVAKLHAAGLEPADALAAASTAARNYLGVKALGEDGGPADLVLYDADPRDAPEVLKRPALIMLRGRIAGGTLAS